MAKADPLGGGGGTIATSPTSSPTSTLPAVIDEVRNDGKQFRHRYSIPETPRNFISRLYREFALKEDPYGAEFWTRAFLDPSRADSVRDVYRDFVNSSEFQKNNISDVDFVNLLYKVVLYRNPNDFPDQDFSGRDFWVKELIKGKSRLELLNVFLNSNEFGEEVHPLLKRLKYGSLNHNLSNITHNKVMKVGSIERISWDSTKNIDKVVILYKACESCGDYIVNGIPNRGFFDWKVKIGNTTNTKFKIWILGYETGQGSVSDLSYTYFTIVP